VEATAPGRRVGAIAYAALLGALVAVAFAPSARVGFFVDDFGYLNATLRPGWWYASGIWDFAAQVVRPVTVIAIGVQHEVFGFEPYRFHVVAMGLVLASGLQLWRLARRLGVGELGARAAAAVLVLHATNGYTIAWTASTSSLYVVNVALFAATLAAVPVLGPRRRLAIAALIGVALLAREVALVLPALLTLVRMVRLDHGDLRDRLRRALGDVRGAWGVLVGYLLVRLAISGWAKLQPEEPRLVPILNWTSFSDALPDSPVHLRDLLLLATSPFRYGLDLDGLSWPWWVVVVGALTWVGILALAGREARAGRWVAPMGLAWFAIGIIPPAFLQAEITYVNYADLALPGLALCVGAGLDGLLAHRRAIWRRGVAVVGLAVLTWVAFNGGNTLVKPPLPIVSRPAQIVEQLRAEHPVPPPPGSTVVIRDAWPEDVLWTSNGDLVRVLFDDPTLVVVFEPPAG
jgi:hypothetical protein